MNDNPELHYLDHVQNTSMGKHCFKFAKAPRFQQHRQTSTDFNYNPKPTGYSRSCSFGFGNRSSVGTFRSSPSPNKYNVSKFPINRRSTIIGFGREDATFGTFAVEIKQKAKIPPPGTYQSQSSIKSKKFSIRKRLKTQFQLNRIQFPGPGEYEPICINKDGKFPLSTIKNVRYVFVDSYKQVDQPILFNAGPGSYDLQTASKFSNYYVSKMRSTTSKPFGTQKRKGPEQIHRLFVPGPGIYQTFSSFGEDKSSYKSRLNTQY